MNYYLLYLFLLSLALFLRDPWLVHTFHWFHLCSFTCEHASHYSSFSAAFRFSSRLRPQGFCDEASGWPTRLWKKSVSWVLKAFTGQVILACLHLETSVYIWFVFLFFFNGDYNNWGVHQRDQWLELTVNVVLFVLDSRSLEWRRSRAGKSSPAVGFVGQRRPSQGGISPPHFIRSSSKFQTESVSSLIYLKFITSARVENSHVC